MYQSETSKHRGVVAPFCVGYGIDIGFGGDPVTVASLRMDMETPYANTGDLPVQLGGDCRDLYWFRDNTLDFVYSSHVLEDFDEMETEPILREWTRVLKIGGRLVLLLPDQARFAAHCSRSGHPDNPHHSIAHFSLDYVKAVATRLNNLDLVEQYPTLDEYSFAVVFRKTGKAVEVDVLEDARSKLQSAWKERDQLKYQNLEAQKQLQELQGKWDTIRALPLYGFAKSIFKKIR